MRKCIHLSLKELFDIIVGVNGDYKIVFEKDPKGDTQAMVQEREIDFRQDVADGWSESMDVVIE